MRPSIVLHLQKVSQTHPDERVKRWAKDALERLEIIRSGAEGENLFDQTMKDLILENFSCNDGHYQFAEPRISWEELHRASDNSDEWPATLEDAADDFITDQYGVFRPIFMVALKYWAESKAERARAVEDPTNG